MSVFALAIVPNEGCLIEILSEMLEPYNALCPLGRAARWSSYTRGGEFRPVFNGQVGVLCPQALTLLSETLPHDIVTATGVWLSSDDASPRAWAAIVRTALHTAPLDAVAIIVDYEAAKTASLV